MAYRPLVKVGSFPFPDPSEYSSGTFTIVDSSRNVEGKMIGATIREDVSKVECSWKYLTVEQWANILKCFSSKQGGSFSNQVEFFNQDTGSYEIKEMYVGDRPAKLFKRDPLSGEVAGWLNCKISLIEV